MVASLNPWWTDAHWQARDTHLEALEQGSLALAAPAFVDAIELGDRSTHVIRGPRQVGKSTGLKQLARRFIADGCDPRQVVYVNLDLLEDQPVQELAATIVRAREIAAPGDNPCALLLDEVTAVPNWARAVKAVWDNGVTRRDTVLCTGSSAIDLASQQLEGLPGRRGAGRDFLLLPQSFAAFARAIDERIPASPRLAIDEMLAPEGRALLARRQAFVPALNAGLERYLVFGGLPAAIAEAATGARHPSQEVQRVVWDSVSREVRKRGASEPALRALLERVIRSLSSKTSWPSLAREMDMPLGGRKAPPDPRSVSAYIELLGLCYELMTLYFWKTGSDSNDLSRDKKLYFGDPLLQTVVLERTPGLRLDVPATVENVVALALYRCYEDPARQADGFGGPDGLHAYETSKPGEIDFACGRRKDVHLVEVKFRRDVTLAAAQAMRKAFPGRPGIVASRDSFDLDGHTAVIPAALLLWALGWTTPAVRSRPSEADRGGRVAVIARSAEEEELTPTHDFEELAPIIRPLSGQRGRYALLPFFEAYFSNYIEGTRFSVDEAADIALGNRIPASRPQDAHDILGTYRIVASQAEIARVPRTAAEYVELLRQRHAVVLEGRPDRRPGQFKEVANEAGGVLFVEPDLVGGTLARGFELAQTLTSAFARAVLQMFVVAETHPFDDGNGRVARITMNSELVAADGTGSSSPRSTATTT